MTLLSAVNDAQRLLSLAVTTLVVADGQETQNLLYGLARRLALDVLDRDEYPWPLLRRTKTFTASLASLQASGLASDYHRAITDTFWNRTTNRMIQGPLSDRDWAVAYGASFTSATWQSAMFRYDGLHIFPAPTVADTIAYEYIINTPVLAVDGVTYKTTFTADNDSFVLGDDLLTLWLVWSYKQAKGRDYAEDLRNYELTLAAKYRKQRGAAATLSIVPSDEGVFPPDGIIPDTGYGA